MFLENALCSVNQYFLMFPWKNLLGWHSFFLNSGLVNRAACGLPVCQILVSVFVYRFIRCCSSV